MATPVFCCGCECGVFGAGTHWTIVGTPSFETTTVRTGLRAIRCNPSAATEYVTTADLGTSLTFVGRFYVRFVTLPSADIAICLCFGSFSFAQIRFKLSDSSLYAAVGTTLGGTGVAVTTGAWYCIDFKGVIVAAANDTCDVQVDGVALGQAAAAGGEAGAANIILGFAETITADAIFDDVIISGTAADYPIGPGKVLSFVPDADGTHTATTTTIVKGTIATPVGANVAGATDVFNWVNARPILGGATDNTRLVNQQTAGTTLYAEEDFEATTEALPPRAVEVLTADRQASTASGGFSTKLNDNGTEDVIITRSAAGVISDRYVTKQYATMVGGGAWTLARFNALKARFGYSGDATPDQYWRGIMIEAEFAVVDLPNRPTIVRQAVMRATLR